MRRVAVVTGASSGIGRETAVALARAGFAVFAHGHRNVSGLRDTAKLVRAADVDSEITTGDLATPNGRAELIESAFAWCERLGDSVVAAWANLAGADVLTGEAAALPFEAKLTRLWQVDVAATVMLSREAGLRMRGGGGSIVNVGWDQAEWGMEGDSGEMFATTKGAIMSFTRSLAKSLAPDVRVNCIAPGWIRTKWGDEAPAEWQQRAVGESLVRRWGEASDVAAAIRFLMSDEASFVNGQVIRVNGGFAGALSGRELGGSGG